MEKLFISNFMVYETPSEEAKGKYSAGLVLANRLNGDEMLVGSYDPNREEDNKRKVGFITFRKKFETEEAAEAFKSEHEKKYPIGSALSTRNWAWGEIDEEGTALLDSDGANVHKVKFIGHDTLVAADASKEEKIKQMQYKGKVTEPVS